MSTSHCKVLIKSSVGAGYRHTVESPCSRRLNRLESNGCPLSAVLIRRNKYKSGCASSGLGGGENVATSNFASNCLTKIVPWHGILSWFKFGNGYTTL